MERIEQERNKLKKIDIEKIESEINKKKRRKKVIRSLFKITFYLWTLFMISTLFIEIGNEVPDIDRNLVIGVNSLVVILMYLPILMFVVTIGLFEKINFISKRKSSFKMGFMIISISLIFIIIPKLSENLENKYSQEYKKIILQKIEDEKRIKLELVLKQANDKKVEEELEEVKKQEQLEIKEEDRKIAKELTLQSQLVEEKKKQEDYFTIGMEYMESENRQGAIEEFRKVKSTDANYDLAKLYINDLVTAEVMRLAEQYDYANLSKSLENMKEVAVEISGEIIDIQEYNDKTLLALNMTLIGNSYHDSVVIILDGRIDSLRGDYVTVYGNVKGNFKGYKSKIAEWWGKSFSIYLDSKDSESRVPVIKGVLVI